MPENEEVPAEGRSISALKARKWKIPAIGILSFVAGSLFNPVIGQWGARLGKILGPSPKDVFVAACSPLQESRIVLRVEQEKGYEIVGDQRADFMNETQILVRNDMDQPLTNVTLLIYPIFASEEGDKILFSKMYAQAIVGSSSYTVERKKSAYVVKGPIIHSGEYIYIQNHLAQPAGYILELSSDQVSRKAVFAPGCLSGFPDEFKVVAMKQFFKYISERCKEERDGSKVRCTTKSPPFEIPEWAIGIDLIGENIVIKYGQRQ